MEIFKPEFKYVELGNGEYDMELIEFLSKIDEQLTILVDKYAQFSKFQKDNNFETEGVVPRVVFPSQLSFELKLEEMKPKAISIMKDNKDVLFFNVNKLGIEGKEGYRIVISYNKPFAEIEVVIDRAEDGTVNKTRRYFTYLTGVDDSVLVSSKYLGALKETMVEFNILMDEKYDAYLNTPSDENTLKILERIYEILHDRYELSQIAPPGEDDDDPYTPSEGIFDKPVEDNKEEATEDVPAAEEQPPTDGPSIVEVTQ